jgi:hypothetical protein
MALSFNDANGSARKSDVTYMKLADGDNVFRILPDSLLPSYTYWVKGKVGEDGKQRELPFECLQFIPETERFDNSIRCPIRDAGLRNPNDTSKPLAANWSYKCLVINKATGKVEVLQLKKGILEGIKDVAKQMGLDPTNMDTGTWFTVIRKKTGPLPFNVDYTVAQLKCKSEPLSAEHKELALASKSIDEMFPRETYAEQAARLERHLNGSPAAQPASASAQEAIADLD